MTWETAVLVGLAIGSGAAWLLGVAVLMAACRWMKACDEELRRLCEERR
jgi:hypothetical protein